MLTPISDNIRLTHAGSVLSVEVASLVALKESGGLGGRSGTTGKTSVEADYTLHACSILGGAKSLDNCQYLSACCNREILGVGENVVVGTGFAVDQGLWTRKRELRT